MARIYSFPSGEVVADYSLEQRRERCNGLKSRLGRLSIVNRSEITARNEDGIHHAFLMKLAEHEARKNYMTEHSQMTQEEVLAVAESANEAMEALTPDEQNEVSAFIQTALANPEKGLKEE